MTTYLWDKEVNKTYRIHVCGHERRNEICEDLTVDVEGFIFIFNLNDYNYLSPVTGADGIFRSRAGIVNAVQALPRYCRNSHKNKNIK